MTSPADDALLGRGRIRITGLQALVRGLVDQVRRDRASGRRTAALCSGYPGSPLAGLDQLLGSLASQLSREHVHFVPGINEELAASVVAGSQLIELFPHERYDGVIGMWFGKAPGLDRALDALRHANFTGIPKAGGAVAVVGDDPFCKSSSLPSHSERALAHAFVPTFFPADAHEVLALLRHAYALSRYSGLWAGMKVVADVADGGQVLETGSDPPLQIPALELGGRPFEARFDPRLLPPHVNRIEEELLFERLEAVAAYAGVNGLDPLRASHEADRVGLVASGALYRELERALDLLGLDATALERLGLRLLQVQLVYPLQRARLREFARGLEEIVVVDTRLGFLEDAVRGALYDLGDRPRVLGQRSPAGQPWLARRDEITGSSLAADLGPHLAERLGEPALRSAGAAASHEREATPLRALSRPPQFCSGCPHSASTRLPPDAVAGGGIGCHTMALLMDREVRFLGAMGSEGAHWTGLGRFVDTPHLFQNLGDGTYHHSGRLAVRQAVEAGATLTYKLLYNGSIAMTGGQAAPGEKPLAQVVQDLLSDGVRRVVCVSQDPAVEALAGADPRVACLPREDHPGAMQQLQREPGVTALIYDQVCANQKQRLQRRGELAPPSRVVLIDEDVCEGCGDCVERSSCASLRPVATPLGRKTQIHETSCTDDRSCLEGDCPAFLTVEATAYARARERSARAVLRRELTDLPEPESRELAQHETLDLLLVGVGSTGVVTVNALLVEAARLDGLFATHLDQTGLAQRGGKVVSHCRIGRVSPHGGARIADRGADLLLAFDPIGAADPVTARALDPARTRAVANAALDPPGGLVATGAPLPDLEGLLDDVRGRVHSLASVPAEALAEVALGETRAANVIVLGAALQLGLLPVSRAALERAIDRRGATAELNRRALAIGRVAAHDPDAARGVAAAARPPAIGEAGDIGRAARRLGPAWHAFADTLRESESTAGTRRLHGAVADFALDLEDYQSRGLAISYLATLTRVAEVEASCQPGSSALGETVARELYRLLAYKDEYEVARLLLRGPYRRWLERRGVPGRAICYHLHPPLLRALGLERKLRLPARVADPLLVLLAAGKRIRGSRLDPFAQLASRRAERELAAWYGQTLDTLLDQVQPETFADALEIAAAPARIRGFEGRKAARDAEVRSFVADRLPSLLRPKRRDSPPDSG